MHRYLKIAAGICLFSFAALYGALNAITAIEGIATIPANAGPLRTAVIKFLIWLSASNPIFSIPFVIVLAGLGFGVLFWHPEKGWSFFVQNNKSAELEVQVSTPDASKLSTILSHAVVFSKDSKDDIKSTELTEAELSKYLDGEVRRHPFIFLSEFHSIPIHIDKLIIVLSFIDGVRIVDRVITRRDAFPLSDPWISALKIYGRCSGASYRSTGSFKSAMEQKRIISDFEELVACVSAYILEYNSRSTSYISDSVISSLYSDAIYHIGGGDNGKLVSSLEMILSHAHKILLSCIPSIVTQIGKNPGHVTPLEIESPQDSTLDAEPMKSAKRKILIVEDEDSIRKFLSRACQRTFGNEYEIYSAGDGKVALDAIINNDFELILSDIVLPGADGIEVMRSAKAKNPNCITFCVTGFAAVILNAQKAGFVDIEMEKPVNLRDIVVKIKDVIDAKLGPKHDN